MTWAEKLRILMIGAHTGDPIELCGGTLAKHARRGDEVAIVALTGLDHWNEKLWAGPSGKPAADWVKKMRQDIVEETGKILGVKEARNLNYDIPIVDDRESLLPIIDIVREFKPDIVLSQHPEDHDNPDHMVAASLVVRAVGYSGAMTIETEHPPFNSESSTIIYCANFMPASEADFYIDVKDTIDLVGKAYFAADYQRDPSDLERLVEAFKVNAAKHRPWSGMEYAEPFKYSRLAWGRLFEYPEYLPFKKKNLTDS